MREYQVVPGPGTYQKPLHHMSSFQPAERAVLGRAARSSAPVHQAAGALPSASQTPTAVLVDLAGEEASARKVCTNPLSAVPDPENSHERGLNPFLCP